MLQRSTPWSTRVLVFSLLLSLFSSLAPVSSLAPLLAEAAADDRPPPGGGLEEIRDIDSMETRYGLVAILVDEETWGARTSGREGLFSILGNTRLSQAIETYAEDVQAALPWTKSVIITVGEDDSPVEIQRMLEKLYFEGNPEDNDATKLSGVVLVGDVPIPVVNKNGHRFMSVLPYTDFEEPSYVLDGPTQDFVPNVGARSLQMEVWHGLIVPPLEGQNGIDMLGDYFDKNHRFHEGEEEFTTFEQRAFIGDFVTEEDTLNNVSFDSYKRFLRLWEEMAYYHYSNDLVEDIYLELMDGVTPGDGLDNDQDGDYDEEAQNGRDDDGDGLIDEDLGDNFFGIDNDEDGQIDEDGFDDNNNDKNWTHTALISDPDADYVFEDQQLDEDPPGDANGDGCPFICGEESPMMADHDNDGYPSSWEIVNGFDPYNPRKPHMRTSKKVNRLYGTSFATDSDEGDEAAGAYLAELIEADMYGPNLHASCFATDGSRHPEWDDDGDFFCDEDGSSEVQIWLNDSGTRNPTDCAYNDGDCDGSLDEDPIGLQPNARFDLLPDIQSISIVENMTNRYAEIFDQPQGVWNRVVASTGRYESQDVIGDTVNTDFDTDISLISKKDEVTWQYLYNVNEIFENELTELVEDHLQEEVPLVIAMQFNGTIQLDGEEDSEEFCSPAQGMNGNNACLQFINHSANTPDGLPALSFIDYKNDITGFFTKQVRFYGQQLWEIPDVSYCTPFGGTAEEGGQVTMFNALYSGKESGVKNVTQAKKVKNCMSENRLYAEDIPELCEPVLANNIDDDEDPVTIRALDGAKIPEDMSTTELMALETGFPACFEFKELKNFTEYESNNGSFSNWLSGKLRKFRKQDSQDDEEAYTEFLDKVEQEKLDRGVDTVPDRTSYENLDLIPDSSRRYTVYDLFEDMGWEDFDDNDIDVFVGLRPNNSPVVVNNPQEGYGMNDVDQVRVTFEKIYLKEDSVVDLGIDTYAGSTQNESQAWELSSIYKHVEPTDATLNAQIQAGATPDLPIDATRRLSFKDSGNGFRELAYPNVFDVSNYDELKQQIEDLAAAVEEIPGGDGRGDEVMAFLDLLNLDQIEDALEWKELNIDEKHHYVLTHYLGQEEPIVAKAREGYEMVSLIARGDSDELFFAFDGSRPDEDGDLEWKYRSQALIDEALAAVQSEPTYEPLSNLSNTTPVPLADWIVEIAEWMKDLKGTLSSYDMDGGGYACGDPLLFQGSVDNSGSGIPDGADPTVSLELTSEDQNVLQAGGQDYFIVSVSSREADGRLNTSDSYTEVELVILSGAGSLEVSGSERLKMTGGIATFALKSQEPGDFVVLARPVNRDGMNDSNTLSGSVTDKLVKVTTYRTDIPEEDLTFLEGNRVEILDASGMTLAIFNPENGDLRLRNGAQAELREGSADLPTRVVILDSEDVIHGSLFLIPREKRVGIGSGSSGAFVQEVGDGADAVNETDYIDLFVDGRLMGFVGDHGQIGLSSGYFLAFSNPGELNMYDPIVIRDGRGDTMFTVQIQDSFDEASLQKVTEDYEGFLTTETRTAWWQNLFTWVPSAVAAVQIPDGDGDLLDNLEEWTIGTDADKFDSDNDSFGDGEEIFSGFDPLTNRAAPLFTDIDAGNVAYVDLVTLYLRGVIKGYSDGSFRPDQPMTREEFVKVNLGAVCIACDRFSTEYQDELLQLYAQDPFPDSDINPDLYACVAEAKTQDIVSGYTGEENFGYFLPRRNISIAEATKVLVETGDLPTTPAGVGEPWYRGYVETASAYNLFPAGTSVTDAWLNKDITRAEFVMMAANLIDVQDCRDEDRDGDGLSDTAEELVYGTNPDLADTDGGGVLDLDEILANMDALDASDDSDETTDEEEETETPTEDDFGDLLGFSHASGVYVLSDQAQYEQIATSSGSGASSVNVFTDETPADGVARLTVRAEIRDQSDVLYSDDDSSVIEFVLSTEEHGTLLSERVQVKNGQAEATFLSSEISGDVTIDASIVDGSLPSENSLIKVYPGEPVRLDLQGDSTLLPAGGESVNKMMVQLFDSFGNLASNGFYTVTLDTEGGIEILDLFDEDPSLEGLQVTTPDGFIPFRVLASPDVETAAVTASILDIPGSGARFEIQHVEELSIEIAAVDPYYFVGVESPRELSVRVKDGTGATMTGFQGTIYMSLSDPSYGNFVDAEIQLEDGEGTVELVPGTLAGVGHVIAESPGFEGGSLPIELKPGDTFELRVRKQDDTNVLTAGKRQDFVIEGYDMYGNLATTDSTTEGMLRSTDVTAQYATLSNDQFRLNQGVAQFSATPINGSGSLNLVATADNVLAGTWGGDINFSLTADEISQIQPQMLYASVLGAPFGDVTETNYIGGWLTFNGKTQAVTSLISEPVPKERLALIDSAGSIDIPDGSNISYTVSGAGSQLPLRIQWRSFPDDRLKAELFYVLPDRSNLVEAELLTTRGKLSLEEDGNGWILREDSATVVKVREDGQIVTLDPAYSLSVNASADGLGFVVLHTTEQVMTIDFNNPWSRDVQVLETDFNMEEWPTMRSGVYIRPTAETEHHLIPIPSGNSSKNAKGMALINPEQDLGESLQPSLGYRSLESAQDSGVIGWERDNKHLLLFAAGNTVGQSNLYYGSEVGVVLGDPTIALTTENETNSLGFTEDIGTMVSASKKDVAMLVDTDYNADGQTDVLMAYEDGRIEVLQNYNAPVRLQNRGPLLFVENGISSIDKGDFNKDGVEDLLIVTEESCYVDEMCLYLYENIGGGYVAHNLTFNEISAKPTQVEVADLNNDDYDDIVLVNENMKLYTIWNNRGEFDAVDLVRDFGLRTESSQNLWMDVALHTDGLEQGSVNLSILREVDGSAGIESGANEFLDLLDLPRTTVLSVDGSEGSSTSEARVNTVFESADQGDMPERFVVDKRITDTDGGKIEVGDLLEYTLTISNRSGVNYDELYVTDMVSASFRFIEESLSCDSCDETDLEAEFQSGNTNRPWVFGPATLDAGESMTITYQVSVGGLPSLNVMLANDFYDDYVDDNFLDIVVSPEGNTTGAVRLYYSDDYIQEDGYRRINYREKEYSPETHADEYGETAQSNPFGDENGNGIPDFVEGADEELGFPVPPAGSYDVFAEQMGAEDVNGDGYYSDDEMFASNGDADGDGLLDSVDQWVNTADFSIDPDLDLSLDSLLSGDGLEASISLDLFDEQLDQVTAFIEEALALMTCGGGCIAMPGSISFLTPGDLHDPFTGTTLGTEFVGTPVFGVNGYAPPPVCAGQACSGSQVMRLYLSPTTTLGLGMAICLGPHPSGQCFAFNIPLLQALGVCDAINGFMADAMSGATSFASSSSGNQLFNVSGSQGANGSQSATGMGSSLFEGYNPPVSVNTNIQVPGFPSIFTEWWKGQKFELFKMLDFPDITFIYPDPQSIAAQFNAGSDRDDDTKKETEELESGMLGLEKFLNLANGLPLIEINPEPVYIHYPTITEEEIELVQNDWQDWVSDTKTQWENYRGGFDPADATDLQKEAYDSMNDVIDDAIAGMEANLAVLENYKDIPNQILAIRELQSYYAKVIICYLDAVLNFTVGYLTENAGRIEAWGQWVVDLKNIVSDWQTLINASVDMMDSCDKCTNQRFDSYQLLFSLFAFIPEFPVIQMPKLPDIIIDVSNIQAGVDIKWPDVQFVPESVHLPDIPRLNIPQVGASIESDIDLDLNIPVLPEFPIDFEQPELPGLPLPDLPSLPPPPAIPQFHPAIKSSVEIGGAVIKIVCLIRNGFVPTQESKLKAQIEELTQRPGDVVLPFDLVTTVEWPEISLDFLDRIEITTYLNLTANFDGIYDLIEELGDLSGDVVQNLVNDFDRSFEGLNDGLQDALSPNADVDAGLDIDVDLEVSHPATDVAQDYQEDPLVKGSLDLLVENLNNLQAEIDAWAAEMPEDYNLVATQHFLGEDDPLLHRYDEIMLGGRDFDQDFLASIEDTPLADVAILRDSLIGYVEDWDAGTSRLEGLDGEGFNRYLAEESEFNGGYMLASEEGSGFSGIASFDPLALAQPELDPQISLSEETATEPAYDSLTPQSFNEGIYIYNPEEGVASRLVDYTEEANGTVNILFVDYDDDGDDDIVYSMGGDVYMKENHSRNAREEFVFSDPQIFTAAELTPQRGSVYNLDEGKNGNMEASFSFSSSYEAVGYDISFYDSLDAQEAAPDENIKRYLLFEDEKSPLIPFTDGEGQSLFPGTLINVGSKENYESEGVSIDLPKFANFTMPELRSSRLVVESLNGKANLYNAFKRTVIGANGELNVEESVILQSTKKTTLKVSSGDKTTKLDLPAYTWLEFGREEGRKLRVESGEMIWIQENEIVDGQAALEGMALFPEEQLILDTSSAKATLLTAEGAQLELDKRELFVMDRLNSPDSPSARIDIENGAFYNQMRAIYADGSIGTLSDNLLLNPQVCADDSAPLPIVDGPQSRDLAIFSTLELSAESSFDSDSEIVDAYWDLDATEDADGDGIFNNDAQVIGLTADIGPYEDVEPKEVTLWLTDLVGNQASTTIDINIYVPNIYITDVSREEVGGTTDPLSPEFPFYLVREREGALTEIGDGHWTDLEGNYIVPLNDSDLIAVYDNDGATIAEFNPVTKQLLVYDNAYEAAALPAEGDWPSRLVVYEKFTQNVMASFLVIVDNNRFVNEVFEPLEDLDLAGRNSVTVYVASDDESYEVDVDGVLATNELGIIELSITPDGNITFFDPSFELRKRPASSLDEYLVLEVYDNGVLELEVWPGNPDETFIQTTDELDLPPSGTLSETPGSAAADFRLYFEDISSSDPLSEDIGNLVERGVLNGYDESGVRYFKPDQRILRSEFTKIILSSLCIVPRAEAYNAPNVFNDILDTTLWYYPYTKESQLRGLIEGYQGEVDGEGFAPFKPEEFITTAEASKIVLEALEQESIISLPEDFILNAESGRNWYENVIEIAQDLTPYLTGESSGGDELFVITGEEASQPNHQLTRYEFVEMSIRVLQAYNCFELDSDGDGLINFDEENTYGTDPYNPDTDEGGITDGVEVSRGTDPLNPGDDFDSAVLDLAPGVYAVNEPCFTCPCDSNVDYAADLRPGDTIFAIIRNALGQVFGISNKVTLTEE